MSKAGPSARASSRCLELLAAGRYPRLGNRLTKVTSAPASAVARRPSVCTGTQDSNRATVQRLARGEDAAHEAVAVGRVTDPAAFASITVDGADALGGRRQRVTPRGGFSLCGVVTLKACRSDAHSASHAASSPGSTGIAPYSIAIPAAARRLPEERAQAAADRPADERQMERTAGGHAITFAPAQPASASKKPG